MYTKEQKLEVLHHVLGVYEKTLKSLVKANKARQEKIMNTLNRNDGYLSLIKMDCGICRFLDWYCYKQNRNFIYMEIFNFILKEKGKVNANGYLFNIPYICKTYQEVKQTFRDRISWLKQAINHYENS